MKGTSARPGGSLRSKPTWLSTFGCLTTSAFFFALAAGTSPTQERIRCTGYRWQNSALARLAIQRWIGIVPTAGERAATFLEQMMEVDHGINVNNRKKRHQRGRAYLNSR